VSLFIIFQTNRIQALAYYYIRTLIYRPAVGSSLGHKAAPALLSIAESSKHVVQIIQLLEERSMNFSFCLNKCDLLMVCGMTLLYQVIDLKEESKMMKEDERLVNSVIKILDRRNGPGAVDFRRIASRLITVEESARSTPQAPPREGSMPAPSQRPSPSVSSRTKTAHPMGRHREAASSESDLLHQQERLRRMTVPNVQRPEFQRSPSRQSFDSVPPEMLSREVRHSSLSQSRTSQVQRHNSSSRVRPNLDYLSLSNSPSQSRQPSPPRSRMQAPTSVAPQQTQQSSIRHAQVPSKTQGAVTNADWEVMLGALDGGLHNVYDAIYGGGSGFITDTGVGAGPNSEWSPDSWDLSSFTLGDFSGTPAPPQSVLSLSDESLSSGEEVAPSELGLSMQDFPNNMVALSTEGYIPENLNGFTM
jgi:hypothetical protein